MDCLVPVVVSLALGLALWPVGKWAVAWLLAKVTG